MGVQYFQRGGSFSGNSRGGRRQRYFEGPKLPGLTGSSEQFTSGGLLYMAPMFTRDELTVDDINGGCMFLEVAGGVAWGRRRVLDGIWDE